MLLAAALPTVVGLALLVALAAGVQVLLRDGLLTTFPWPLLGELRAAAALVLLSACWLAVSAPYEGRVLLVLTPGRGSPWATSRSLPAARCWPSPWWSSA